MPIPKPVIRVADFCTGHPPAPPRQILNGSTNVFVNEKPMVRVSDTWEIHGPPSHKGISITGSLTVFCNNLPVFRTGDSIDCGSMGGLGSTDVFCG